MKFQTGVENHGQSIKSHDDERAWLATDLILFPRNARRSGPAVYSSARSFRQQQQPLPSVCSGRAPCPALRGRYFNSHNTHLMLFSWFWRRGGRAGQEHFLRSWPFHTVARVRFGNQAGNPILSLSWRRHCPGFPIPRPVRLNHLPPCPRCPTACTLPRPCPKAGSLFPGIPLPPSLSPSSPGGRKLTPHL